MVRGDRVATHHSHLSHYRLYQKVIGSVCCRNEAVKELGRLGLGRSPVFLSPAMSVPPSFGSQHKVMSGKKRIMVCGGAGFIGCHLCTRLVEMVTNTRTCHAAGPRSDLRG